MQIQPDPLLGPVALAALSSSLEDFTSSAVHEALGLVGRAAQERGDVAGALRELGDDRIGTLTKLFLLGVSVPAAQAYTALAPLSPDDSSALIEVDGGAARARLEIRPYSEDGGDPWWVFSDFGSDVRPGALADDHVLGIGGASLTLAQATQRTPVRRALDIGTGSGVQSLHLSQHAESVTATDLSGRALRLAATTAAVSGVMWDLRLGSLLEPIGDETFDLIVANPPFVVSPGFRGGEGGYDYRDSGLSGDGVCHELLTALPRHLNPGGSASMLANWIISSDGDWVGRVTSWLAGSGCDAWIWQREVLGPGEYVSLWLRDAGEVPGSARWVERYEQWVSWLAANDVIAVGMGLATLWKPRHALARLSDAIIVCEDVPQAVEQPSGAHIGRWIERQRWISQTSDAALLAATLQPPPDLIRAQFDLHSADAGWSEARVELRQSHGMRWELETDTAIASLVGACTGHLPLAVATELLALSLGVETAALQDSALPVVRDLISRGFLEPVELAIRPEAS